MAQEERQAGMAGTVDEGFDREQILQFKYNDGYAWDDDRLADYFVKTTMNWYINYFAVKLQVLPHANVQISLEGNLISLKHEPSLTSLEEEIYSRIHPSNINDTLEDTQFLGKPENFSFLLDLFPVACANHMAFIDDAAAISSIKTSIKVADNDSDSAYYYQNYERVLNFYKMAHYLRRSELVTNIGARVMLGRAVVTHMENQLIENIDNELIQEKKEEYHKAMFDTDNDVEFLHERLFSFLNASFKIILDENPTDFDELLIKWQKLEGDFLKEIKESKVYENRPSYKPLI